MKNFPKIPGILLSTFFLLVLLLGGYYIYQVSHYTHITAVFEEADPFPSGMKVYFKGFEIGKVVKIEPNQLYTETHVKMVLYPKNLKFPDNIYVTVKNYRDTYDYVNIHLPDVASAELLKNNSVISGHTSMSAKDFFNNHAEAGTLDVLIESLASILDGVDKTLNETSGLVADLRKTVRAASPNIVASTKNFSNMSKDLSGTAYKVNNAFNEESMNNIVDNVEMTSGNVQSMTHNLDCATRIFPKTMNNIYDITSDVSEMTSGVNDTLQKPFGVARLFMGQPVPKSCKK